MAIMVTMGIALFGVAVLLLSRYRLLTARKKRVDKARNQVIGLLQTRTALISPLAETLKDHPVYESEGLGNLLYWQKQAAGAKAGPEIMEAGKGLKNALSAFFELTGNCRELYANAPFQQLQGDIGFVEEKLDHYLQLYNKNAGQYNYALSRFPDKLVAAIFHLTPQKLYRYPPGSKVRNIISG